MNTPIDPEQREKMKEGAKAVRAVRAYLEALEVTRARPGRKSTKTTDELEIELIRLRAELDAAEPMKRLDLAKQLDKVAVLARERDVQERAAERLDALAQDFIKYAKTFAGSRGTTYEHWLLVRVPPEVLAEAGIKREP